MNETDSRNRFFDAAQEILAVQGYGALKLAVVCKSVGVTTGSFYHAFDSWSAFTSAFLDNWRRQRTTLIADIARASGDPIAQLEALLGATLQLNHRSEGAIRVWAAVDPEVAHIQALVDKDRFEVVREAMVKLVGRADAARYSNWGLNILLGFEASTTAQDTGELEWQLRQVLEAAHERSLTRKQSRKRSA